MVMSYDYDYDMIICKNLIKILRLIEFRHCLPTLYIKKENFISCEDDGSCISEYSLEYISGDFHLYEIQDITI
jgi:hypothetical protein